jgi:hypothetical protein
MIQPILKEIKDKVRDNVALALFFPALPFMRSAKNCVRSTGESVAGERTFIRTIFSAQVMLRRFTA